MAAPTPTPRVIPVGFKQPDGFKTLITLSSNPAIQLWEKTVKPPGIDGGEKIDTTTMLNTTWRTFAQRQLRTLVDSTAACAYDPDVFTALVAEVNLPQTITITFPDKSTLAFYGFMQKAEAQENKEGEMPMVDVTITPTNWDYVNGVEAAPTFTPAAGT